MSQAQQTVVGVWEVHAPDAPFPRHMMTFTAAGTLSQSNPHEGNKDDSDSSGHGIWRAVVLPDGTQEIEGKFVEMKADRHTGVFTGKGVISFRLRVAGDSFEGMAEARRYNEQDELVGGPYPTPLSGRRLVF